MNAKGPAIGIVAGGGTLPDTVAQAALERGFRPVLAFVGDGIGREDGRFPAASFAWGRTGDAIDWMKRQGVRDLVFCGTVSSRPDFRALMPSWRTLRRLPAALSIVRGGDDRLLRNLTAYLEREGFRLLAVQEVAPKLLTPAGTVTCRAPDRREAVAIGLALRAARALGDLDAGQAAVASGERVVALEGIEGTSAMMQRVADLRRQGRIQRSETLALVKAVKPDQDRRFDLPSIGVRTVAEAREAGIRAIGVSAGESLILNLDDTRDAANAADIAIVGLTSEDDGRARAPIGEGTS